MSERDPKLLIGDISARVEYLTKTNHTIIKPTAYSKVLLSV